MDHFSLTNDELKRLLSALANHVDVSVEETEYGYHAGRRSKGRVPDQSPVARIALKSTDSDAELAHRRIESELIQKLFEQAEIQPERRRPQ